MGEEVINAFEPLIRNPFTSCDKENFCVLNSHPGKLIHYLNYANSSFKSACTYFTPAYRKEGHDFN